MRLINQLPPHLHALDVMQILKDRRGHDFNDLDAHDWAREILHSSDYISDMCVEDFASLLEIIAKLPLKHPLYVRLFDEIEGMV